MALPEQADLQVNSLIERQIQELPRGIAGATRWYSWIKGKVASSSNDLELGERVVNDQFFGARWWRFDFHTHTPASFDYGKGPQQDTLQRRSPRQWLLDFMGNQLDCVAITDHNTANWIDELKEEYESLRAVRPEGFRELHLFPGVEITVDGGAHLLAIFDPSRAGDDIVAFLGAAGLKLSALSPSEQCTTKSFLEVSHLVADHGGLPIPAHADRTHGVLTTYSGQTLIRILESNAIFAVELDDPTSLDSGSAGHQRPRWTTVLGSDSHHPSGEEGQRYPGSHFTWVKMGRPSIEGLRLALLDGASLSVQRSVDCPQNPNSHAALIINNITVSKGRFAGRRDALHAEFSPWMTSIIGGRGTGKSTLVEMMRLCLRRDLEVPDELQADLSRFAKVPASRSDSGALTADTQVAVVVNRDGECYRLNWDRAGHGPAIERKSPDGHWRPSPGDVRTRFPASIFSQKQILALASDPSSLLRVIDDSDTVDGSGIAAKRSEVESTFLRLRSQIRELQSRVSGATRLLGEIEDLDRKIEVFEKGDHRKTLIAYRRFSRQRTVIKNRSEDISRTVQRIREAAEQSEPIDIREDDFEITDRAELGALEWLRKAAQAQSESSRELREVASGLAEFNTQWLSGFSEDYGRRVGEADLEYEELKQDLAGVGIADPDEYSKLIQRRQILRGKSKECDESKIKIRELEQRAREALAEAEALRLELSRKRKVFVDSVLKGNEYVRISLFALGSDPSAQEASFRKTLSREDGSLERDILSQNRSAGILAKLYQDLPLDSSDERELEIVRRIRQAKTDILSLRDTASAGPHTKWFGNHIRSLPPEALDRIELWQPYDDLRIEYRHPDGSGWSPIQDGSPGQKSAALLAFLLSYGNEPIILDQPEDDLDNHLIYDLIVQQIKACKRNRQVIVVTHNPNIVVNGDTEAVIAMDFQKGQCLILKDGTGCLQERGPREEVCRVMEGGLEAFDSRYKRLAVEILHAG